jgi:hypothetical protein
MSWDDRTSAVTIPTMSSRTSAIRLFVAEVFLLSLRITVSHIFVEQSRSLVFLSKSWLRAVTTDVQCRLANPPSHGFRSFSYGSQGFRLHEGSPPSISRAIAPEIEALLSPKSMFISESHSEDSVRIMD